MLVSAPLRNRVTKGIVFSEQSVPPKSNIREILKIHGSFPVVTGGMLRLIKWMSDYYIVPEGLVLKQTLAGELFSDTRATKTRKNLFPDTPLDLYNLADSSVSRILDAVSKKTYRTFLLHSPSRIYEYSMVKKFFFHCNSVLVVLPEVFQANLLFNLLKDDFHGRICLLHGEISKGMRSAAINKIIAGHYDLVVGTRAALFSPLKNISLIVVLDEHNSSYKLEDGIRYNVRDVAVMRGYTEQTTVLLSSISPSVDSYFNAINQKYTLLQPSTHIASPKIMIIDMRFEKVVIPNLSSLVFSLAKKMIHKGRKVMFVINRRGYSTLLNCSECGHTEKCPDCNVPLVLHKEDSTLKCHYCGLSRQVPGKCPRCHSHNLNLKGSGTQRMQESLAQLLGINALRFDSDLAKKKTEIDELQFLISQNDLSALVGTKMMIKRSVTKGQFALAAVLNVDSAFNVPDFRASEKTFSEIKSIAELVEPQGIIAIQTRFPQNTLFKHLKKYDYASFVGDELRLRKEFNFPPYSKLLKIIFTGDFADGTRITEIINGVNQDIEVLGPVPAAKRSSKELSLLLKSNNQKKLNSVAKSLLSNAISKVLRIRIDVNPLN